MILEEVIEIIEKLFAPLGIGTAVLDTIDAVTSNLSIPIFTSLSMLIIGLIVVRVVFKLL